MSGLTPKADTVTYELRRTGEKRLLLRVPATWRVTFGPPFAQRHDRHGMTAGGGYTVRIYEGKQQRMALTGITQYWAVTDDIQLVEDLTDDAKQL